LLITKHLFAIINSQQTYVRGDKMVNEIRDYMCELFSKLSSEERREVIAYLQGIELSTKTLKDTGDIIREKHFSNGLFCPHCNGKHVVRYGYSGERQRYLCKSCKRTFTDLTGTPLHRLQLKEKFFQSLRCMLEGYSLPKTAKVVGVSIPTAFYWRHKILAALRCLKDEPLSGVVEADETYVLYSEKGNRCLNRSPRKRGGKAKKAGISDEQVCVVVARDRIDNTISEVAALGRPSAEEIDYVIGNNISPDSIFCTDKHRSFKRFARLKELQYVQLNLSQNKRVVRGIYHIQNVNSYHQRFKSWMRRFNGVATKYLSNYVHWFEFLERIAKGKTYSVAQNDLLLKACATEAA